MLTHVNKKPRIEGKREPNSCLAGNRPETFSGLVFWALEGECQHGHRDEEGEMKDTHSYFNLIPNEIQKIVSFNR